MHDNAIGRYSVIKTATYGSKINSILSVGGIGHNHTHALTKKIYQHENIFRNNVFTIIIGDH